MPSPSGDRPHARGTLLVGGLAGVKKLWGEAGIAALREHLPAEASRALCDEIVLPVGWYPEEHFEGLCAIVWHRLAREDDAAFASFVRESLDAGWTIFHRTLMRLATPQRLARRAPDLWRHDHSHGELSVDLHERSGTIRITGYPYPRGSIMHRGQTEALRYILSHARVNDVRALPHAGGGAGPGDEFVVTFAWT